MPYVNEILITASLILILIALVGCLVPVIPGPPIALASLFMAHYSTYAVFEIKTLIIYGILIVLVTIMDYIWPVLGARKFGGTKRGMWGAAIGLVAGIIFFPPLGFFIGAFAGAYIAEITGGMKADAALKAAAGSLLGILAGTVVKVTICLVIGIHILLSLIN